MKHLLEQLGQKGIRLHLDGDRLHIQAPQGALTEDLKAALLQHRDSLIRMLKQTGSVAAASALPPLAPDPAHRHDPFPLTEVQHAYWLGRSTAQEMANVATHLYLEQATKHLDVPRLNAALNRLIQRHDMLRLVVQPDGLQRILPEVEPYQMVVHDCSHLPEPQSLQNVEAVRERLSHQVFHPGRWPLFDIQVTLLPGGNSRLHFSMDGLVFDFSSIFLLFREWQDFYNQPDLPAQPLELSFRDCVLALESQRDTGSYRKAEHYWMERAETLPSAPLLPMRTVSAQRKPEFRRREWHLEKARWENLKSRCQQEKLTPSALLLAVYAEVLARWSRIPHFTLNVTFSNRKAEHPQIAAVFGNFTSLVLHEVDRNDLEKNFADFAHAVQQQLLTDLEHADFSGMNVLREWNRLHGTPLQAAMPVVFTSAVRSGGEADASVLEAFGPLSHAISQTSQVWLDHQAMESHGGLLCIWDAVEDLFEEGVLDAMFFAFQDAVTRLAEDEASWDAPDLVRLADSMLEQRKVIHTEALPDRPLHAGFVEQARLRPQATAVVSPSRTLTYGDLLAESAAVANGLLEQRITAGEPVAVLMNKGWEQVVAVYGILLAGAAYLPIDAELPVQRQLELLQIGEVRCVLTQPEVPQDHLDSGPWKVFEVKGERAPFSAVHQKSLHGPLEQLAYVIFTSGTTGTPKGVMIDHLEAMNTVQSMNRMFKVGSEDRVLAVSSLSFDLSVYDVFGLLGAGGAVVLPEHPRRNDPMHWRELITDQKVNVWNSAPQLMRMLMDSIAPHDSVSLNLRTVLLSGDFIPLDLPGHIRHQCPQAEVISLGGATEASIWSIFYPIREVDPAWTSIPYGKALPNQTVQVLDELLRPCPDQVVGHIMIGGAGLAKGYWKDRVKTRARFVVHPTTGERLYRTGDLGYHAPDGNIMIVGREDRQIKIRGYRVEPGEIEAVLMQHPAVRQAVVMPTGEAGSSRQLVAYLEAETSLEGLQDHLSERLPAYMVPRSMVLLDRLPVSSNGKVNHRALAELLPDPAAERSELVLPRNATEQQIFEVWSCVISGVDIGVTDNFFDLGGDSVMATELIRELNLALPDFQLEMHEMFENITIEALAELYHSRTAALEHQVLEDEPLELISGDDQAEMLKDVQNATRLLESWKVPERAAKPPFRRVLLTGATGWIGSHVLMELLSQTQATVYCLIRGSSVQEGRERLLGTLQKHHLNLPVSWQSRIEVLCGDLDQENLGLDRVTWEKMTEVLDGVYHFGASLNLISGARYSFHQKTNVQGTLDVVRLAMECKIKALFALSPMTICRREHQGKFTVLHEEKANGPEGLLTGYAQSKWAAEQVLLVAAKQGVPVRVFRTSHALPASRTGQFKAEDTYVNVLRVALKTGLVPEWAESQLNGIPVDILAELLVQTSLIQDEQTLIHLDNQHPMSLKTIMKLLLNAKSDAGSAALSFWLKTCQQTASEMEDAGSQLASLLFAPRGTVSSVERMFHPHPLDAGWFARQGKLSRLSHLTPAGYWKSFAAQLKREDSCLHP